MCLLSFFFGSYFILMGWFLGHGFLVKPVYLWYNRNNSKAVYGLIFRGDFYEEFANYDVFS